MTELHDAADEHELIAFLTRRSFLYSIGALALAGCGAGGDSPLAAQQPAQPEQPEQPVQAALPGQQIQPAQAAQPDQPAKPEVQAAAAPAFVHPGLLHTETDFARMRANLDAEPWKSTWNLLKANSHTSLTYTARPQAVIYRGDDGVHAQNYGLLFTDAAAAYQCALRWKISGTDAYANKAIEIMNAWAAVLTAISGDTNGYLAAGLQGYQMANAAEIMRSYSGWAPADFARFQTMMRKVFYSLNHDFLIRHNGTEITHYWANWDLCNMSSMLAIGVLCDDQTIVDEAVSYFKGHAGNGASSQATYYLHPGYLGQWQETGRDQGHNTLGIALMGAFCEMAWNQGLDLYGWDNNRFLAGAEYVAKCNLIESGTAYYSVPYVTYDNVDNVNQTVLATGGQGTGRPCWALVVNHYVNRKGLAAPYSKKFADLINPEGGGGNYGPNSGGYDQLGFGSLTCARPPIAAGAPPSGLTGYLNAGKVELSWWGSAYATSYTVKRATVSGGPYTVIQSGITDLLTFTDAGVVSGNQYYVVTAITAAGETAASNQVTVAAGTTLHTWLKCDETGGTIAADASGKGHPGTLVGGGSWVAGRKANALGLNGTSGYLQLPNDLMLMVGDFTVSTWVYWDASKNWARIFDFGSGTSHFMFLTPRASNGLARFGISVNGSNGALVLDSNAALPVAQWVHVAVTLSGRVATLYVNGVAVNSMSTMFLAPFRLGSSDRNFIGRSQYDADPYFNGRIDDFRIYHGALSASEVAALAAGG
ncbi:MAG: LamG-like jellyroll fold domain-containing protein [Massilia sp.]